MPLLVRAGWKPAEPPAENVQTTATTAADAPAKDARPPNAPPNQAR
jgi:hypothetical protein